MVFKILISGAGIAGPSLAYFLSLAKAGHQITIIERFPAIRKTGAQVDLRAQGIEVVKRSGLLDAICSKLVPEEGVSFVNSKGVVQGSILANKSGQGAQSLTSEYEIMRGDLVDILYDATRRLDGVKYIFGKEIESFTEEDDAIEGKGKVAVVFSDGSMETFDLLVDAGGQGSRIRRSILPPNATDPYRRVGLHVAYFFVPRIASDDNLRRVYNCSGGRMIFRRSHNATETQVYFFLRNDDPRLSSISKADIETQKAFWADRFRDAGWETARFLEGLKTTEDFYCHEVVQVKMDAWSSNGGRFVLLGDAAYCPCPLTGMGTTGAFVGAYVLAGEILRHPNDARMALRNYEKTLRPFVDVIQELNTTALRLAMPESQWGVNVLHFLIRWLCWLKVPDIAARLSRTEKGGWKVPEYEDLRGFSSQH
ncbi:uncharacterized protein BHQ10_006088 [Talaromyces amestolkiae]|uniref:FAD-binding domain-containing protein n=1 Tax=Talaromyces amestolkiae TaxID=1196081 RepID=A0A364L2Q3_TALAM|nr:uncharacterized protein BHQ10_006088 [Talaromyces amestolkiae]RAO70076.1 hypothetical protein BHQ10_006088 [Talaromyces amestolkiae]